MDAPLPRPRVVAVGALLPSQGRSRRPGHPGRGPQFTGDVLRTCRGGALLVCLPARWRRCRSILAEGSMRFALVLAIAAVVPATSLAETGAVDWQRRVARCTGSGAANLKDAAGNPAVARIGAEKAARLDALRNCLEVLKG